MNVSRLFRRPRRLASAAITIGLVSIGLTACQPNPHYVLVVGDGSRVALGQQSVQSGIDNFLVASNNHVGVGGSNITLFQLKSGATTAMAAADFRDEYSRTPATAAKGTRELTRDINAFGLADVLGASAFVTANLLPGTYYLTDLANFTGATDPVFTPLQVTAGSSRGPLSGIVSVHATSADRFTAPTNWPATGSYVFANTDPNSPHFMDFQLVKPGTTDAQVQAYFDSHSRATPPFAMASGRTLGNDLVSPGNTIRVYYVLPPGTYVLWCFVADPTTGESHASMGMHKVVTLT